MNIRLIKSQPYSAAMDMTPDKEMVRALSVIDTMSGSNGIDLIVARWYKGRSKAAKRVYCSVWLRNEYGDQMCGGTGMFASWQTDLETKEAHAFFEAMWAAGFNLSACPRRLEDMISLYLRQEFEIENAANNEQVIWVEHQ